MSAVEDRADDVRRQNREAKEPCRIGRYDALNLGNVLKGKASICEKLIPDSIGADEKTHQAAVRSCGFRSISDDNPHLFAGAFEARRDGQRCHLVICLGFGLLVWPDFFCHPINVRADAVLIQRHVNAVHMDLDPHDARTHECVDVINLARGNIFGPLDQSLLSCGVGSDMLDQLEDGGRSAGMASSPTLPSEGMWRVPTPAL